MNEFKIEIMDKITKTCTCKSITRATIKKAINNGATTVEEVEKTTGAGSGSCKGKNCSAKIQEIIDESKKEE
ncbi:(2Fe-2S)-binding protein [Clostridium sediminicola]|uniref:(2Fe-2S)-binding protein n=1 Tax=Clostridium sediminicola TaxID=3114879 RepID=UPI0031F1DF06